MTQSLPPMNGKVCVVTGATSGIGKGVATRLAKAGATVVLGGRSADRLVATVHELKAKTGSARLDPRAADLSLAVEARRFASEIARGYPEVHVLVNNAGAIFALPTPTAEGVEPTWALNVVAPFLLTRTLEGPLRRAGRARVIMVSSEAHRGARLDLTNPAGGRGLTGYSRYAASKLALVLLTHEFARRWADSGVSVNAVHPGLVRTRFGLNNRGLARLLFAVGLRFGLSPDRGAEPPLRVATDPSLEGVTGTYFRRGREVASSRASYDDEMAGRLWESLEAIHTRVAGPD